MSKKEKDSQRRARRTKDRVLQARIPSDLDEELRGQAEQLGLSVSTVVRNVLLNTFELVEDVVADSSKLAQVVRGKKTDAAASVEPLADLGDSAVVGWQEAVLNLNGICDECNSILHKGERAGVGLPMGNRPVLLCLTCLESLSPQGNSAPTDQN